jgi:dipeptidyl-peptidase 4
MRNILITLFWLTASLAFAQQKEMTLEDAILGRYTYLSPQILNDLSWKDNSTFSYLKNDTLWTENVNKNVNVKLLSLSELNTILKLKKDKALQSFPGYSWFDNEHLQFHNSNNYFILNTNKNSIKFQVTLPENAEYIIFSKQGMFFSYTVDNDLYLTDIKTGKSIRVTHDGGDGIVNGKTVHRTEFGISKGIFNSPKGNFVAFYRKNETMVADYPLVNYSKRMAEYNPVKYPMAGMKSHHVKVGVYNIATEKTIFLKTGGPADHYLTNISWSPDERFIIIAELNRDQDHMQLNCYDIASGEKVNTILEEKDDKYVEPLHPVIFSKVSKNEFYYLSRKDGWFHIYKYTNDGKLKKQITKGEWEVSRIIGFDPCEKYIFFEANKENYLEINIYRVEIKSGNIEKITNIAGIHHGILSPEGDFLLDNLNAPDIPSQQNLIYKDGNILRTIHKAADPLSNYSLGENKLVTIKLADGKTELTGRLILPKGFDPSLKYPLIVYVYGGPHSQLVNKSWLNNARWWQYFMASKGFIAFTMDNRGTNNRGKDFEATTFRLLGIIETKDQMKGIEYLKSLPFVDKERIGVHGWSYGGFMTLNLMLRHPETFKVGVAGGPVVDWSLYEAMYGERYMDTPENNPVGYAETNMTNYVLNLDGKLMLIHGTQDDVVVMQHSMKFIRECVKQGKQVDFFTYPTHPHNVRGKDRLHLMEKVSSYFMENL